MSNSNSDNIRVLITKDDRLNSNWVQGTITGGYKFEAKMFDNGSEFGINKGRVSKLGISKGGKSLVNYDRGWDIKPRTPEMKALCESVLTKLNSLGKEADIGKQKDLLGKIADNKQKVSEAAPAKREKSRGDELC